MQKRLSKLENYSSKSLKYAVAAMLIAIPLFPKFPFLTVPGTHVAIRLEDFLILVVVGIWAITILPNIKNFLKNKVNLAAFLLLCIGLVSVLSGIFLTQTVVAHIGLLHWLRRVEYISAMFIGFTAVKQKGNLAFFIKIILLVLAILFVVGLGQKYANWPIITTQNSEYAKGIALRFRPGAHLVSTFAGHYDLATYLILITPLFYVLLLSNTKVAKQISKTVLLGAIFISMWLLVNTASRISIVSYMGSTSLALLLIKKYKFIPLVIIFSIIFTLLTSNLIDRYMNIFNVAVVSAQETTIRKSSTQTEKASPMQVFEDRSTSIRLNVEWPRAIRAFKKNPVLGTGYSSITLATDNGFLRILGEVGLLGITAFTLLLYRIIKQLTSSITKLSGIEKYYTIAIIAAIPGVMLNMVFIDVLVASKFATMFWLMVGFALGSGHNYKNEENI